MYFCKQFKLHKTLALTKLFCKLQFVLEFFFNFFVKLVMIVSAKSQTTRTNGKFEQEAVNVKAALSP